MSLWDLLPDEIQIEIRKLASATLIQQTYKKIDSGFLQEIDLLKKDRKLQFGTISSISYSFKYFCRITLLNNKKNYYYKKKLHILPHEITNIQVLAVCVIYVINVICVCSIIDILIIIST